MGVKWLRGKKPSDLLDEKQQEMKTFAVPVIASRLTDNVEDKVVKYTPVGVEWNPPHAKVQTPSPAGKLKKSWKKSSAGKMLRGAHVRAVWTDVEYAPYVEYGTRPHPIRAKDAQALVYYDNGGKQGAKVVQHPGTRPVYMLTRAVSETRQRAKFIAEPVLQNWAKGSWANYRLIKTAPV